MSGAIVGGGGGLVGAGGGLVGPLADEVVSSDTCNPPSTFVYLYGEALDIELASSDRAQLFTTARRKTAINDAVKEFVRKTDCTVVYGGIAIVDGTAEYDLYENFCHFRKLAEPPSIQIVSGSNVRYIQGPKDFRRTSPAEMDRLQPSWQSVSGGTPSAWYLRTNTGRIFLGMTPAPDITGSDTWTFVVPYVGDPPNMMNDGDIPFTVGGFPFPNLFPYFQALVHYAAARLEPLRKNYSGVTRQMQLYTSYVADFLRANTEEGQDQITLMRDYFSESTRTSSQAVDPRR